MSIFTRLNPFASRTKATANLAAAVAAPAPAANRSAAAPTVPVAASASPAAAPLVTANKFKGTVEELKSLIRNADYDTITSIDIGDGVSALREAIDKGLQIPMALKEFRFALKGEENKVDSIKQDIDLVAYAMATQLGNSERSENEGVRFIADFKDIVFSSKFVQKHPSILGTADSAKTFTALANKHPLVDSPRVRMAILEKVKSAVETLSHRDHIETVIPGTTISDSTSRDFVEKVINELVKGLDTSAQRIAGDLINLIGSKITDNAESAENNAGDHAADVVYNLSPESVAAIADFNDSLNLLQPQLAVPAVVESVVVPAEPADAEPAAAEPARVQAEATAPTDAEPARVQAEATAPTDAEPAPAKPAMKEREPTKREKRESAIAYFTSSKNLSNFIRDVGSVTPSLLNDHPEVIVRIIDATIASLANNGAKSKNKEKLEALKNIANDKKNNDHKKTLIDSFVTSIARRATIYKADLSYMEFKSYMARGTNKHISTIIDNLVDVKLFNSLVDQLVREKSITISTKPKNNS